MNMKWIQPELLALQSEHRMRDGRTDGRMDRRKDVRMDRRMDGVKPAYPPTTS